MRAFLILTSAFLLAGCNRLPGGPPIPQDKFAALYADLLEIGQRSKLAGLDSARSQMAADSVMHRMGYSRDDYNRTVEWLNGDVARWKKVGEETVRILEERSSTQLRRR